MKKENEKGGGKLKRKKVKKGAAGSLNLMNHV